MEQDESARTGNRNADELRRRVEAASGGEPAAGLEAEGENAARAAERPDSRRAREGERPAADEVTREDAEEQTRRVERIQQAGEGIHGVDTEPGTGREAEEEVRRVAEGSGEGD